MFGGANDWFNAAARKFVNRLDSYEDYEDLYGDYELYLFIAENLDIDNDNIIEYVEPYIYELGQVTVGYPYEDEDDFEDSLFLNNEVEDLFDTLLIN